jgi:hypothetical protein
MCVASQVDSLRSSIDLSYAICCKPITIQAGYISTCNAQEHGVVVVQQAKPAVHGQLLAGVAWPPQQAALAVAPLLRAAVVGGPHVELVAHVRVAVTPQRGVVVGEACERRAAGVE